MIVGVVSAKEEAFVIENHVNGSEEEDEVTPLPTESIKGRKAVELLVDDSDEEAS